MSDRLRLWLMAAVVCSVVTLGCTDRRQDGTHNQSVGTTLVNAIIAYEVANGKYPASLDNLSPVYVRSVPKPRNASWEYLPPSNTEDLYFGFTGDDDLDHTGWYDFQSGQWIVDTK